MKININDTVEVILSETGLRAYRSLRSKELCYLGKLEADGCTLKDQLWVIMREFAPYLAMHLEPPFEGCSIWLEDKQ